MNHGQSKFNKTVGSSKRTMTTVSWLQMTLDQRIM